MLIRDRDALARLIKSAAAAQGLSLAGLGRKLGLSQPSISRTVNRSDMTAGQLQDIAAALGCVLSVDFVPLSDLPASVSGQGRE